MGIDLTTPSELDWLAEGRDGEVPEFDELVPADERRERAEELLREHVGRALQARDSEEHTDDELRTAADGVLSALDASERERVERDVWEDLADSDIDPGSFVEEYWRTVAERIVDYWDDRYRGDRERTRHRTRRQSLSRP